MIDNERVKQLEEGQLEQIADFYDEFDCFYLDCHECPFQLDKPFKRDDIGGRYYRCALAYAKELYRRQNG